MSVSLFGLALTAAYAGMLGCCLGMERHWKQLASEFPRSWRRGCRPLGMLMLALSAYLSMQLWPVAMAWVAWLGLISLSGVALLFLLPYKPRLALGLPLAAAVLFGLAGLR